MQHPRPRRRSFLCQAGAAALALPVWRPARAQAGAAPGVSEREILIGQSIGLMQGRNAHGTGILAGVQACLADTNRDGGVHGRRLVLRTLDDEGKSGLAAEHARKLVSEGVFVLFGCIEGGPSNAVMQVSDQAQVPLIAPMAGSPTLRRPHHPLVFPVRAEHKDEFRALMAYGQRTGLKRAVLFHADSDVGRQHLANAQGLAAELGIGFAGGVPFKGDVSDAQLAAAARRIAELGADLVINHGSADVYERLVRAARAAGGRMQFWGVNSGSTDLAARLGPLAQGMVFAQVVPNPWSRKTAVAREYQASLRAAQPDLDFSYSSLEGYASARALVAMLRKAGPGLTRASLLKALVPFQHDLGGMPIEFRAGDHAGSRFVDLAMVSRDGRFLQ